MPLKDDKKNDTTITNKRIILIVIALSLSGLIVLAAVALLPPPAAGLAPNMASTQLIPAVILPPRNDSNSISSNQVIAFPSPPRPFPTQFGPPPFPELSATQTSSSTNKTCTLTPSLIEEGTPQQIEGPYFVDGMPNRSDIRSDPLDGSVQVGIRLRLVLHVYDVDNGQCVPLSGAKVDIWHANSQGVYSGVQDAGTTGKKFLRGYQVTDDNGTVLFTTIYPGWYQGRAIHIHVKVRTFDGSEKTLEWTSQFYLNNSINEQVHMQHPYSDHGPPDLTNEEDGIYKGASTDELIQSNTGEHLMLNITKDDEQSSYLGTFNIVLNSGQSRQ